MYFFIVTNMEKEDILENTDEVTMPNIANPSEC